MVVGCSDGDDRVGDPAAIDAGSGGAGGSGCVGSDCDGGDGGAGGNVGGQGGDMGGSGGSFSCEAPTVVAGCNACIRTNCLDSCEACEHASACVSLMACLVACGVSGACATSCAQDHADGVDPYVDYAGCFNSECGLPCNGGDGAGGSGGSAGAGGGGGTGGAPGVDVVAACDVKVGGATGNEPDGIIPVCCALAATEKVLAMDLVSMLNNHRVSNGRVPLVYDDALEAAMHGHCLHAALHPLDGHIAPEADVASPFVRAPLCGTSAHAENLATVGADPSAAMSAWKGSPADNANMLNVAFSRVGAGYFGGTWGLLFGQ